jgi:hypothetical protein
MMDAVENFFRREMRDEMPSRIVCFVILIYWLTAASLLLTRDVLPELTLGYPPDLHAIASAGKNDPPVRWSIQVVDDPKNAESHRSVGEAVTSSLVREGWYELKSRVSLDSEGLLKGTPFASVAVGRLGIDSRYVVDPKGNLQSLSLEVTSEEAPEFVLTVEGRVVPSEQTGRDPESRELELKFRSKGMGRFPGVDQTRRFEYEPRSVVGNMFGPLDRLPGLRVGQRWESRMVNPLSGHADRVQVEVVRRTLIYWNSETVSVFEVLQSFPPLSSARSWVRTDGAILRQEVPFPFVRLLLERERDLDEESETEVTLP